MFFFQELEGIYFRGPISVLSYFSFGSKSPSAKKSNINRVGRCLLYLMFHLTIVSLSGCRGESADTVWFRHLLSVL